MGDRAPLAGLCRRLGLHHDTVAVCVTQFGSCVMQTIFMFYYVKVFLNRFHITEAWFQIAQILFMIWNALNDPLFGYLQDVGDGWIRSRKKCILYGAPLFVLSFILPWFNWANQDSPSWVVGMHLIVALFFYDGLFSFVLLAWCALFAEISTDHASRVRAVKYSQTFILLGTNVIVVMEKYSNSLQDFGSFQFGCVIASVIGFVCYYYTGKYAPDKIAQVHSYGHLAETEQTKKVTYSESFWQGWQLTKEVLWNKDFLTVACTNFFHTCRSTSHLNFAAIYTESLVPRQILPLGSWSLSGFYWCCTVIPQLIIISNSRFVVRYGPYRLFKCSLIMSVICSSSAFLIGRQYPGVVMGFMLLDSIAVHSVSPLFMILFPDIIDADMLAYKRSHPISSLVFSMNALIVKPAQSIAPMLIVFVMDKYNYSSLKSALSAADQTNTEFDAIRDAMFALLCLFPLVLALAEYMILRNYTLGDKHLEKEPEQLILTNLANEFV